MKNIMEEALYTIQLENHVIRIKTKLDCTLIYLIASIVNYREMEIYLRWHK